MKIAVHLGHFEELLHNTQEYGRFYRTLVNLIVHNTDWRRDIHESPRSAHVGSLRLLLIIQAHHRQTQSALEISAPTKAVKNRH